MSVGVVGLSGEFGLDTIRTLMSSLGVAVILHGERHVVDDANDEFAALLGYESRRDVIGLPLRRVVGAVQGEADTRPYGDLPPAMSTRTLLRADGSTVTARVRRAVIAAAGGPQEITVVDQVIDNYERVIDKLRWQVHHDQLTGLLNRGGFAETRLTNRWLFPGHVHVLDLDRFKQINDRFGHVIGDEVLVAVSSQLSQIAEQTGSVAARWAGDEFLLLSSVSQHQQLEKLLHDLAVDLEAGVVTSIAVSVSHGWALASSVDDFPLALSTADARMYCAKRHV
ncbi:sensor domain-containing diguanylate cyclase [Williamsia sterculiae]|uniref:Diguanylate cyclase (GGDEF) domain-containing protein n=1 Tax=Williamsia sterculiae TaxID=1344003 RepID=A0A1N7HB20_9NOCA|nr:sensor domain-containing diguanylate cyclase [Williamsia sterculiae]SIS22075.1 diguanylate cyclase (GGDEF) domain-containing protein [Williamsia sterculiae]